MTTAYNGRAIVWNAGRFLPGPRAAVAVSVNNDLRTVEGTYLLDGATGEVVWHKGLHWEGDRVRPFLPHGIPAFQCRDLWIGAVKWEVALSEAPNSPVMAADVDGDGKGEFLVGKWCIGTDAAGQGDNPLDVAGGDGVGGYRGFRWRWAGRDRLRRTWKDLYSQSRRQTADGRRQTADGRRREGEEQCKMRSLEREVQSDGQQATGRRGSGAVRGQEAKAGEDGRDAGCG